MVCLKCGYCCINYEVIIADKPEKGIKESNLIPKHTGDKCKHLTGDKPGNYSCVIHNCEWYNRTPCYSHTQIEIDDSALCRMGAYVMRNNNNKNL